MPTLRGCFPLRRGVITGRFALAGWARAAGQRHVAGSINAFLDSLRAGRQRDQAEQKTENSPHEPPPNAPCLGILAGRYCSIFEHDVWHIDIHNMLSLKAFSNVKYRSSVFIVALMKHDRWKHATAGPPEDTGAAGRRRRRATCSEPPHPQAGRRSPAPARAAPPRPRH